MSTNPFVYRQSSPMLSSPNKNPFRLTREPIQKYSESMTDIPKISIEKPNYPQAPAIKVKAPGIFETPINHIKSNHSHGHQDQFFTQDSQLRYFLEMNEQSRISQYMNVSKANNPDAFILPVSELKESQPVFRQSVKQQATPLNMKDEAFPVPRYNDESIEYQQQLKSLKNSKTPLVGKASVFINESMSIEPQTQRLSSMNLAKTNQRLNHFIKKLKPMPILEEKPIQPNFQTQFIAKIPKSVNQNDEYVIPQIPVENQDSSRSFIRSKPRIFEKQEIYQQPQPLPSIEIPNSTELEALAQELQENYDVGRLYLNYFGKKGLQQSQEEIRYFYCNGCEEFIDQRRQETHECKNKNIIIEAQLRKVDEKLKKITILIENNTKAKSNPDFRRFAYIGIAIIQKARSEVDPNNLSKFVDDLMKVRNSLEQIEPDNPTNQMIHEAMESTRIKLLALL